MCYKKMILKYLIIILVLMKSSVLYSQHYFSKLYNANNTWSSCISILETDSGYIGCGISGDSITGGKDIVILKINSLGNLVFWKNFGEAGHNYYSGRPSSFHKNVDNGYSLGGSIENSSGSIALLLKFNEFGDTLWSSKFEYSNGYYQIASHCRETLDKGFILVGDRTVGAYNADVLLIKTDSLGNKEWEKTYGYGGVDYGFNVLQTHDGGYLIGGYSYIPGQNYSGDPIVIKSDSLGNKQWHKYYGSQYPESQAVVGIANDSNYIIGTTYADSMYTPEASYRRINIIKVNENGVTLWNKKYGNSWLCNTVNNIKILSDGSIIIVGYYDPGVGSFHWGWLFKINENGDSLWFRDYRIIFGESSKNDLYDVYPTNDKGFITCGQIVPFNEPPYVQHMWILKLDSVGCDTPGCDTTVAIPEIAYKKMDDDLYIYPNPARYKFQVTSSRFHVEPCIIEFYDIFGRKVKKIKVPNGQQQLSVDVRNWHNGLYVAVLKNNKKIIAKHKFMVLR